MPRIGLDNRWHLGRLILLGCYLLPQIIVFVEQVCLKTSFRHIVPNPDNLRLKHPRYGLLSAAAAVRVRYLWQPNWINKKRGTNKTTNDRRRFEQSKQGGRNRRLSDLRNGRLKIYFQRRRFLKCDNCAAIAHCQADYSATPLQVESSLGEQKNRRESHDYRLFRGLLP